MARFPKMNFCLDLQSASVCALLLRFRIKCERCTAFSAQGSQSSTDNVFLSRRKNADEKVCAVSTHCMPKQAKQEEGESEVTVHAEVRCSFRVFNHWRRQ